jgi:hypothetical protein
MELLLLLLLLLLTINARDARRITATETKYVRKTAGYTWTGRKTKTGIAKELIVTPVLDKMQATRENGYNMSTERPVTNCAG